MVDPISKERRKYFARDNLGMSVRLNILSQYWQDRFGEKERRPKMAISRENFMREFFQTRGHVVEKIILLN